MHQSGPMAREQRNGGRERDGLGIEFWSLCCILGKIAWSRTDCQAFKRVRKEDAIKYIFPVTMPSPPDRSGTR